MESPPNFTTTRGSILEIQFTSCLNFPFNGSTISFPTVSGAFINGIFVPDLSSLKLTERVT